MTAVYTFTVQSTSDQLQERIDADPAGLTLTLPWDATRGFENAQPGDGAVLEVSDPADKSAWIGDIEDVEGGDGYPLTFLIDVR